MITDSNLEQFEKYLKDMQVLVSAMRTSRQRDKLVKSYDDLLDLNKKMRFDPSSYFNFRFKDKYLEFCKSTQYGYYIYCENFYDLTPELKKYHKSTNIYCCPKDFNFDDCIMLFIRFVICILHSESDIDDQLFYIY